MEIYRKIGKKGQKTPLNPHRICLADILILCFMLFGFTVDDRY
jgi:hypothetical protein